MPRHLSLPLRLRKGARGMPWHLLNAETPNNNHPILKSFPILQILVHPLDSGFRRNEVEGRGS